MIAWSLIWPQLWLLRTTFQRSNVKMKEVKMRAWDDCHGHVAKLKFPWESDEMPRQLSGEAVLQSQLGDVGGVPSWDSPEGWSRSQRVAVTLLMCPRAAAEPSGRLLGWNGQQAVQPLQGEVVRCRVRGQRSAPQQAQSDEAAPWCLPLISTSQLDTKRSVSAGVSHARLRVAGTSSGSSRFTQLVSALISGFCGSFSCWTVSWDSAVLYNELRICPPIMEISFFFRILMNKVEMSIQFHF